MKKFIILAFVAIAASSTAFAGPSSKVSEHFSNRFNKAKNISWVSGEQFDKATFMIDNTLVNAYYDVAGELIGTSKAIAFDKLPKAALETITTKYTFPEFQVKDCIEFVNGASETNYYVSMDKARETVVLEINKAGKVSVFSRTRK